MASTPTAGEPVTASTVEARAREDRSGIHWVWFAGTMIGLIGALNIAYGIAAIDDSRVYSADTTLVLTGLSVWGWFLIAVGAVQLAAGVGIFAASNLARWIGVASAAFNAVVQLFVLPAFPAWAIAVFAIDIVILYGLLAHGRRF